MEPINEVFDRLRIIEIQVNTNEAVSAERHQNLIDGFNSLKSTTATTHTWLLRIGLILLVGMAKLVFFR